MTDWGKKYTIGVRKSNVSTIINEATKPAICVCAPTFVFKIVRLKLPAGTNEPKKALTILAKPKALRS